jgi:hypothetical protein
MDRLNFTKSIELPLFEGFLQEKYPEMMAMYDMIDTDKFKVKGHLLEENKISFTVYCNKNEAVEISNRVQNHIMELYDASISVSYNIHKDGIDLFLHKQIYR